MRRAPIAIETAEANKQHYEVPTPFFKLVLGKRMKYSACWFENGAETLDEAERKMLDLVIARADIQNGQSVLDLGSGWGSLALYLAQKFPKSNIRAVSASQTQADHINAQAQRSGFKNLTASRIDLARDFPDGEFDRIMAIEVFEHMRNYAALLKNIAAHLAADGKLFVHIFAHKRMPSFYQTNAGDSWMADNFFAGGFMPCYDIFDYFDADLATAARWQINGAHYARTLNAWLAKLKASRRAALRALTDAPNPQLAYTRWKLFFIACAEFFAANNGEEWFVSHHLLQKQTAAD